MNSDPSPFTISAIQGLWTLLWGYWAVSALRSRRSRRGQGSAWYLIHLVMVLPAYLLPLVGVYRIGFLAERMMPRSELAELCGMLLVAMGVGFAVWARKHLGSYWSANVTIKNKHRLIRTGPYRLVRHPIYTGLLTALIGTAIVIGQWHALVAVGIAVIAMIRKIRLEERWLGQHMVEEYRRYQAETRALVPLVV
jgi:protein-S-isoprenylcysteine O-methyltransferase Ste14